MIGQSEIMALKRTLQEELTRKQKLVESLTHRVSLRDDISELSAVDNHPADIATEVFERSKDIGLRDNEIIQVNKIREALQRIEEGLYGKCEVCGRDIPAERLEAMPQTTLCVNCKNNDEYFERCQARPIEEESLNPPFGRVFRELGDDNSFYGEDAWLEVSRYGTSSDITHSED